MISLPISEVRKRLPKLVDDVDERFERVEITKSGKPKAVIVSPEEVESWLETIDILSDPETMKAIRQGEADIKAGRVVPLEQVKRELGLE